MTVKLMIDETLYNFYQKLGQQNGDISAEWTMADLLWKLAGEASVQALKQAEKKNTTKE